MNSPAFGSSKTFGLVVVGGEGVILGKCDALDEVQEGVLVYEIGLVFIHFVFIDRELV